jgi:hypothetical protein
MLQWHLREPIMDMQEHTRGKPGWAAEFASCSTEADVVRLANDYLATWLPSDLEYLPDECRVVGVENAEDVAYAAVVFTQSELQAKPETPAAAILASMAEVFIAAQARLRQLRSARFDPSA